MKRPNFFILGAPKCGTTSLAAWLAEHSKIYMSPLKEPHFFNTDEIREIATLDAYEGLFRHATTDHIAVGEASVWYLASTAAVANIEAYDPQSRYIVLLRNPIDMAPSLHEQVVFAGVEPITDFAQAWALQHERRAGRSLPSVMRQPKRLIYADACRLGDQLQRLYRTVPRHRVLILMLDDLNADSAGAYARVLSFLDVPHDGRTSFPVHNAAKTRAMPGVAKTVMAASHLFKSALGIHRQFGIFSRIDEATSVRRERESLPPALRQEIADHFADDIARLGALIERDLSHWLKRP